MKEIKFRAWDKKAGEVVGNIFENSKLLEA